MPHIPPPSVPQHPLHRQRGSHRCTKQHSTQSHSPCLPCAAQDVQFSGGIARPRENGLSGTKKSLLPCTPLAIIKLMEYLKVYDEALPLGNRMAGKNVVVINRSEIVGRPLAAMLANDGADVYSVDLNGVFLMRRGRMLEVRALLLPLSAARPTRVGCRRA